MSHRFHHSGSKNSSWVVVGCAIFFGVLLLLNLFLRLAQGAEQDYEAAKDPTRMKTPAQQAAENFFTLLNKRDYEAAARLTADGNTPKVVKGLKQQYEEAAKNTMNGYKEQFRVEYKSVALEPETLVSYRAGGDGESSGVRVFYTERHETKAPNGQTWFYFWHMEHILTINKDNKIDNVVPVSDSTWLMMTLKLENCVKPAKCD